MLKKKQRETLRQLIRDVVVGGTPEIAIRRWAELARWEVWKGRHGTTLREFLSDHDKARLFLADFVMRRRGVDVRILRPEFIPASIRASVSGRNFAAALLRPPVNPPSSTTACAMRDSYVALANEEYGTAETETSDLGLEPDAVNEIAPQLVCDKKTLVELLKTWFIDEVDPGYYEGVANEIRYQVWRFYRIHPAAVTSRNLADIIEHTRPVYDILSAGSNELVGYLAGWATDWLLALNPEPLVVHDALGPAMASARNHLKSVNTLTYQSKIAEIHRRYYS